MMAAKKLPLPTLFGITQAPIFSASGTLSTTPGYQPETRHLLHLPNGLEIEPIPQLVDKRDLARARELLVDELLHDFAFVQEADLAHAIAISLRFLQFRE